jgi:hypothetical protein
MQLSELLFSKHLTIQQEYTTQQHIRMDEFPATGASLSLGS